MKKIFYYAAMALAVSAVMVSCEKKNEDTPEPSKKVRLATPEVTATVDAENGVVTVEWGKVENAVSYEYKVDAGTETPSTELSFTLNVADLKAGDHTVEVKAIPAEDSEEYNESNWGSASFTIEDNTEPVEPSEGLKAWFGTYVVTSTKSIDCAVEGENIATNWKDAPQTFEITISEYEGEFADSVALLMGWSVVSPETPALAQLLPDGSLALLSEVKVSELEDGTPVSWKVMGEINGLQGYEDGMLSTISGCPCSFIFVNNGGSYEVIPYDGDLQAGGTFKAVASDLFGDDGTYTYFLNLPFSLPAGEFSMTQKSSSPERVYSHNFNDIKISSAIYSELPTFSVVR